MTCRLCAEWRENCGEWLVALVVVVALAAGWGLKAYAENAVEPYAADGLSVSYPAGWLASAPVEGVLRFRNAQAGGAAETLEVRLAAAGAEPSVEALAIEADALSLERAQDLIAYRVLETGHTTYRGQPALAVSYVYVADKPDAFQQYLPKVMLGEDLLTFQQERVVIFSLQAPQDEFAAARRYLQALLDSATLR